MQNKITKSILLSEDACDLVAKYEIKNLSKFIDDLIVDNLEDKDWWISKASKLVKEAQDIEDTNIKRGLKLQWVRL